MKNIIDWAGQRARMVLFFVILSLIAGLYSYVKLPKEGEPDIEIPVVFISVPFQGISAEDSEALLVKPLEKELSELKGLKKIELPLEFWKKVINKNKKKKIILEPFDEKRYIFANKLKKDVSISTFLILPGFPNFKIK